MGGWLGNNSVERSGETKYIRLWPEIGTVN
jgi:hypothetical protein